jgi:hypothetical protein
MKKERVKLPRLITIDHLCDECGFFTSDTTVNNGYGCKHPDQEEKGYCDEQKKEVGCCYSWSCPLATEATLSEMKEHDIDMYNEHLPDMADAGESDEDTFAPNSWNGCGWLIQHSKK